MSKVAVIIPNYNGIEFLPACIEALKHQTYTDYEMLVVDNASTDGSYEWLDKEMIPTLRLDENKGFAGGVNAGIKNTESDYVILLNNDTEVFPDYIEELVREIERSEKIFSVSPCMIQAHDHKLIDDAGDGFTICGWAYQRGVGEAVENYYGSADIFSSCAGAAIYRRKILDEIGLFDEMHFAYLEDLDLGYRARIHGYHNRYAGSAKVYHVGSGTSGSRYNSFKVKLASRNQIYLLYKNQPDAQLLVNSLPLIIGIAVKAAFFYNKGYIKDYIAGIKEGLATYRDCKRVAFNEVKQSNIWAIEAELMIGMVDYCLHFIKRHI